MVFDPRRLRIGEWLAGVAGVLGLLALFALDWQGGRVARTGWHCVPGLRWFVLVAALAAVALALAQAVFRAPAIPASLSVVALVLGILTVIGLLIRVVIAPFDHEAYGAWIGLVAGVLLVLGSFLSLREEGIAERDGPGAIPIVELPPSRSGPA